MAVEWRVWLGSDVWIELLVPGLVEFGCRLDGTRRRANPRCRWVFFVIALDGRGHLGPDHPESMETHCAVVIWVSG